MNQRAIASLSLVVLLTLANYDRRLHAEQPSIEVRLSRTNVQIVDPVQLQAIVVAPRGSKVTFDLPSEKLGEFDLISSEVVGELPVIEGSSVSESKQWIANLQIETIYSGNQEIPPVLASVTEPNGTVTELASKPVSVTVQSSAEPNEQISTLRDLKTVVNVAIEAPEPSKWENWLWALPITFLVALFAIVYFKGKKTVDRRQWALHQLALLDKANHSARADTLSADAEEKIAQAVLIVQSYAASTLDIKSQDVEAEELREQVPELDTLLKETEKVRFARRKVGSAEVSEFIKLSKQAVENLPSASERINQEHSGRPE